MDEKFVAVMDKLDKITDEVNVNAVFGEPETVEGRVIIPVAAVSYGVAAATGSPGTCSCDDVEIECECDCDTHEEEACDCENPEECECSCHDEACCECGMPEGMGGASGGNARPIAIIEVTEDGATVKPINNEQVIAMAGIALGAWIIFWLGLVLKTIFTPRK